MSGVTEVRSRGWLAAQGFDTNKNGQVEELQLSPEVRATVARGAESLSVSQLATALDADQVLIRNGRIESARGQATHVRGAESLRAIHDNAASTVSSARTYTWDAHIYHANPQTAEEAHQMKNEFKRATAEFKGAAFVLRTSLHSIERQANRGDDSVHRSVRTTAQSALRNDFWNKFDGWLNTEYGDDGRTSYERAKDRYYQARREYEGLETSVRQIRDMTGDIPDPAAKVTQLRRSVQTTSSTLQQVESAQRAFPTADVQAKLRQQAGQERSQITGRAAPFGGIGAAAGAVVGGAIGYFAGKSVKTAAIGAGIGVAVAGGGGALIGSSIDGGHRRKAADLEKRANEVGSFDVGASYRRLTNLAAQGESQAGAARTTLNIDTARELDGQLSSTTGQLNSINTEATRILESYRK